jgi:hypothetical protein
LRACIAYVLTSDNRLAKAQSAELMASIVAERLIARLERDGFVVMRRPPVRRATDSCPAFWQAYESALRRELSLRP